MKAKVICCSQPPQAGVAEGKGKSVRGVDRTDQGCTKTELSMGQILQTGSERRWTSERGLGGRLPTLSRGLGVAVRVSLCQFTA